MRSPTQIQSIQTLPVVALDTECTGPDFRAGDRCFSVALVWPNDKKTGKLTPNRDRWRSEFMLWPVDPFTREVFPDQQDIARLSKIIRTHRVVFHNAAFDIRALEFAGVPIKLIWRAYEDTLRASHVCHTGEVHELKALALKYLDIEDDDEHELKALVIALRRKAKALGWRTGSVVETDYWLPPAIDLLNSDGHQFGSGYEAIKKYNIMDAKRTLALWLMYYNVLREKGLHNQYVRERRLQEVVYRIESNGVTVNKRALDRELARYSDVLELCESNCKLIAQDHFGLDYDEFNIRSGDQLTALLHGPSFLATDKKREKFADWPSLDLEPGGYTDKNFPSFGADCVKIILNRLEDGETDIARKYKQPAIDLLTNLTEYKLNNTAATYLTGYKEGLHAVRVSRRHHHWKLFHKLNQSGTRTGRFSHSNPNSANVGKGKETEQFDENGNIIIDFSLREVFGPGWGRTWYSNDYDQLQLRIFAKAAGEQGLIDGFEAGYDAHAMVACAIYELAMEEYRALPDKERTLKRRNAKIINFGFIFGMEDSTIAARTGIPDLVDILNRQFPSLAEFKRKVDAQVKERGWVETLGGYRIPVAIKYYRRDGTAKHTGVCDIVQGTEAEIVKNAMIAVDDYLLANCPESFITLQVHDELVFDFPKERGSARNDSLERQKHLRDIMALMMRAGANLDITTPVNCERIDVDWAHGVKITEALLAPDRGKDKPHKLEVRPYRQTGKYVGQYNKYHPIRRKKKAQL